MCPQRALAASTAIAPPSVPTIDKSTEMRRGLAGWHKTKALRVYFKRGVELATEVFERNRRRQLDDLRLVVVLLQSREEFVVDLLVSIRDALRVLECDALGIAEQCAATPCCDLS